MTFRSISIFLATTSFFFGTYSFSTTTICSEFYSKIAAPSFKYQSAVEVEIGSTPKVIELFTTTDGTISPVLGKYDIDSIPPKLLETLKDFVGENGDVRSVPWDVLSVAEKIELVSSSSVGNKFFESRTIPGLQYRNEITLTFSKTTRFLGKDFKPGKHKILTSEIFGNTAIEYMGPDRMHEDLGFELHVRSSLPAGENLKSARVLQTSLSDSQANVHLHMVGPTSQPIVPSRWQKFLNLFSKSRRSKFIATSSADTFRQMDLARVAMLYFDIQMIERGLPMTKILAKGEDSVIFFPVSPTDYHEFYKSIMKGREGSQVRSKSGTVGLRTSHFYDQPDIWGMEVRYLSPKLEPQQTERALNFFQNKMVSGDYLMTKQEASTYILQRNVVLDRVITDLLYASTFEKSIGNSVRFNTNQIEFITKEAQKNDFIKMLFHDWSLDPMFVNKLARIQQIKKAQDYAIALLLRGMPSVDVMKIFIKKSAIAHDIKKRVLAEPNT